MFFQRPTSIVLALLTAFQPFGAYAGYEYQRAVPTLRVSQPTSGTPQNPGSGDTSSPTAPAPAGSLQLSTASVSFGSVALGQSSTTRQVALTNTSEQSVSLGSVTTTGPFTSSTSCTSALAAGQSCLVQLQATPTAIGTQTGGLRVTANVANSPLDVALSVVGQGVEFLATPTSLSFDTVEVTRSKTLLAQVRNNGNVAAPLSLDLTGTNAADFSLGTNTCGASLAANASCNIPVTLTPSAEGTRTAQLRVVSSNPSAQLLIPLSGTGAPRVPAAYTVSSISPTSAQSGQSFTLSFTGSGFASPMSVRINGQTVAATVNSATSASATYASGVDFGTEDIFVSSDGSTLAKQGSFRSLVQLSATSGFSSGGYPVTITGSGFTSNTRVMFGSNLASITSQTPTQLVVTVPAGTDNSTVDVRVQRLASSGADDLVMPGAFSYTTAAPLAGTVSTVKTLASTSLVQASLAYYPGDNQLHFNSSGTSTLHKTTLSVGSTDKTATCALASGVDHAVAANPTRPALYALRKTFDQVYYFNASTCARTLLAQSFTGGSVSSMATSPDGSVLYVQTASALQSLAVDANGVPQATGFAAQVTGLTNSRHMAVAPDGSVYLMRYSGTAGTYEVRKYSASLALQSTTTVQVTNGTTIQGMAVASNGDLFFAPIGTAVYRLTPGTSGNVTLVAGLHGTVGTTDGTGGAARFTSIQGLAFANNQLYVGDQSGGTLRLRSIQ